MPLKRHKDFTERYPYIKAGTYEPMHIKDIWTKNLFLPYASILEYETHNDLKFGKEKKMLRVGDTSLHPLD